MAEDIAEQQVLDAVEDYVIDRHSNMSLSSVGFHMDEESRVKTDKHGYVEFTVENMRIVEAEQEDDTTIWYVSATLYFEVTSGEPIEGSTDVYEAYMGSDGKWSVDWHSS